MENDAELQEKFDILVKLEESFEDAARGVDIDGAIERAHNYLNQEGPMRTLHRINYIAEQAAKTFNWPFIHRLFRAFPYITELVKRTVRGLYNHGKWKVSREPEVLACILNVLEYVREKRLGPVLNRTDVAWAILSKSPELFRATVVDFSDLHERGYFSTWEETKRGLDSVMKRLPYETEIFLEYLKNVGSPFYEKALEYTTRDDV